MSEIGTEELSLKAEYRLKIRLGGPLFQLVNLRTPATPGADYLFHVSNSHVKVDPKFVTDNLVHRLISGRHTVGFKRVWMLGVSEERIRCDT